VLGVRVLTDGRALTGLGSLGGVGTFIRNLTPLLAAMPDIDVAALVTDPAVAPPGVTPLPMHRRFDDRRPAVYEHEVRLPIDLLRCGRGADLVFSADVMAVPWTSRPYVQTLHDVIPLVVDSPDLARQRRWWRRWARRYRRADAVVAISRYTAAEGIRILGLKPERVHVVPNGVGPEFAAAAEDPVPAAEAPYLLAVGEYAPRKAWGDAFAVVAALAERGFPHHLRMAGRVRPLFEPELHQAMAVAEHRIDLVGFVDDLPALYRGASVYLSTSRYEGFGLPLVEAMASGLPVVTYDNSALPEVVGDAGIVVPDGDVGAMADAVADLLRSPARMRELSEAGRERARLFTWERAAAAYREIFLEVAGKA
jgi:glycosyltransferase involved in cell wall biosynthesis